MFLRTKKEVGSLLDTVLEMTRAMIGMSRTDEATTDCFAALLSVGNLLEKEESAERCMLRLAEAVRALEALEGAEGIARRAPLNKLSREIVQLKSAIQTDIAPKLKVAFFPYKASMWNSLATIYEAAKNDPGCVAQVVPVPYDELDENGAAPMYEGEQFPKDVAIIHYSRYHVEAERPDIIFIHNAYDQYNTITRLNETFFASNLKKYTDMLVYVPYCMSMLKEYAQGEIHSEFSSPALRFADKIIVSSKLVKKGLIRNGFPPEKLLTMGSPKLDALIRKAEIDDIVYPDQWKRRLAGKTVYLLNTGCMLFSEQRVFIHLSNVIWTISSVLAASKDNALIWRPHPLTEASIKRYAPWLADWYSGLEEYIEHLMAGYEGTFVFDKTPDYYPAFKIADILISAESSLLYEFVAMEKKIVYWLHYRLPGYDWHNGSLYHAYDKKAGIMELARRFCRGEDPLAARRSGLAKKLYPNADGSCGEKVYHKIRAIVLGSNPA